MLCVVAKGELLHDWHGEPTQDVVVYFEMPGSPLLKTTADRIELARRQNVQGSNTVSRFDRKRAV